MPVISVILPVYNAEKYIGDSIKSILNQTFTDFELIIIDDASTDNTVELIEAYKDARIVLLKKPVNSGYTDSLNMAIKMSKGKYIARMDADDVSMPNRFELQYQFMEKQPNVLVLGSHYKIMFSDLIVKVPLTKEQTRIVALMQVPVGHPTVFIRKEVFTKHNLWYNKEREPAEDYDLWCRVLDIGDILNIDEVLLEYRTHNAQTSSTRSALQIKYSYKIREEQLKKVISFVDVQYDVDFALKVFLKHYIPLNELNYKNVRALLIDFYQGSLQYASYNKVALEVYLREIWLAYLFKLGKPQLLTIAKAAFRIETKKILNLSIKLRVKLIWETIKKTTNILKSSKK